MGEVLQISYENDSTYHLGFFGESFNHPFNGERLAGVYIGQVVPWFDFDQYMVWNDRIEKLSIKGFGEINLETTTQEIINAIGLKWEIEIVRG